MSESIRNLTIDQILRGMQAGTFTARGLVVSYLQRIQEVDLGPEGCNAISIINPDALFLAEGVDAALQSGVEGGSLAGVPVVVKANTNTLDKMPTTGGAAALRDHYATDDAFVVKKLRRAGAVLLGKTNMTELANFMSYHMPCGYSSLGGQVRNYYDRKAEVGGSSSGSGVAMAAGLAGAALGTETNGSIIWPAQASGVVGLKPSIGLVSRTGILPICGTLDTAGPITKCVRDAALVMNAIVGYDPDDPATEHLKYRGAEDFTRELDPALIKGRRIGLNTVATFRTDPEQQAATQKMIDRLTAAGAVFVENCDFPEIQGHVQAIEIMEFRCCMNAYFASASRPLDTLRGVIAYNEAHAETALRHGQDRMSEGEFCYSGRMIEEGYLAAMLERERTTDAMQELFTKKRLDAVLCTGGITNVSPFTGLPSMTVPIGRRQDGTPIGCCFMGERYQDAKLLSILCAVESLVAFRR